MARPNLRLLVLLLAVLVTCVQQSHSGFLNDNSIESRRRNFAKTARRCPPPRAEGANLPLVHIKKRSSNRFLCNGVLVTNTMILTTANCVDEITNTSKYVVGFRGPFRNSTTSSWTSISWACKQPEFEPARSAHHNLGLIVLDKPIEAHHYECLLQPQNISPHALAATNSVQQHRSSSRAAAANSPSHELHLVRIHNEEPTISRLQSLDSPLTCRDSNEISAPHGLSRRHRNRQASVCHIQVDARGLSQTSAGSGGGAGLCNLEGAFVLVIPRRQPTTGARRLASEAQPSGNIMLGLVGVAHQSLDSWGCLKAGPDSAGGLELRMINLSKLWADGQLSRLISHCSMSRR